MVRFIAALRTAGVRISLAESADAFRAIEHLGGKDREMFRLGLQTTLVKDANNLPVFEELFPIFFGGDEMPPMTNPSEDLSPEEAQMLAEALRQFNDQLRKLLDKLTQGKLLSQEELERLAKMVGLTQMDNLHYREWMVQRMKKPCWSTTGRSICWKRKCCCGTSRGRSKGSRCTFPPSQTLRRRSISGRAAASGATVVRNQRAGLRQEFLHVQSGREHG